MKFQINSGDLLSRLQVLAKAQTNKSPIHVLDCVKLTLNADSITLTAGDNENTLTTSLPVSEPDNTQQTICINTQTLIYALRELPSQPVTVTANEQSLECSISYQGGQFKFTGESASDYPLPQPLAETKRFALSADTLRDGINATRTCVANDELRPQMNGVFMDFLSDGRLAFVASDGHKLARLICRGMSHKEIFSFILPAKTSGILLNIVGKQSCDVHIQVDKNSIMAMTPDYTLQARLVEGRYPNYNSVIPENNPFTATVSREELMNALRRTMVFASVSDQLVRLHFEPGQLCLTTQDIDFSSSAEETIPCDYSENIGFTIGFSGSWLIDLLRILPSEEVRFTLADPSRAALIVPDPQAADCELTLLLMPIMLPS